jgi:hypothetical protein
LIFRIFPLADMTWHCFRKGYFPRSRIAFDVMLRLNLYITFLLGVFRFGPIGKRYVETQSLSYALVGRSSKIYQRFRLGSRASPSPSPSVPLPSSSVTAATLSGATTLDMDVVIVSKSFERAIQFVDQLTAFGKSAVSRVIICDIGESWSTFVEAFLTTRPHIR